MFGKLLKHELGSAGRILAPLWGGLVLLAGIVLGMTAAVDHSDLSFLSVFHIILCVLFGLGCFAVLLMAFVVMIRRFYSSVLSDCGYLTNTLPVNAHEIVCSRLVAALLGFVLTYAVIILSVYIALSYSGVISDAVRELRLLLREGVLEEPLELLRTVSPIAMIGGCMAMLLLCLRCYAAMAIGHSFTNSKKLLSVVFFFLLGMAESMTSSGIMSFIASHVSSSRFEDFGAFQSFASTMSSISVALTTLLALVYYFATVFFISRKLNLD